MSRNSTLTAPLTLPLTLDDFVPIGQQLSEHLDPFVWLTADLILAGQSHRLEAIAVVTDDTGYQHAEAPDLDSTLDAYSTATGADGPFATVQLGARDYVLTVTPYGA